MWRLRVAAVFVAVCAAFPAWAGDQGASEVMVSVDKSSQEMSVAVDGHPRYVWPVSTGRLGYRTPNGNFRPEWMARIHFSKKYDDSPMPHSIFFHRGFAIHGTEYVGRLGRPASHGCVRLHPRNAATLFALVRQAGMHNTRIVITGSIAVKRHSRRRVSRLAPRPSPAQYRMRGLFGMWMPPR
jgi:lipoprotein-anchoring transpeptidase ErfK/SrfK